MKRSHSTSLCALLLAMAVAAMAPLCAVARNSVPLNSVSGAKVFRGAWNENAIYERGNVVTYHGASFICLLRNRSLEPDSDTRRWAALNAVGAPGEPGAAGPAGPRGDAGPAGAIVLPVRAGFQGRQVLLVRLVLQARAARKASRAREV